MQRGARVTQPWASAQSSQSRCPPVLQNPIPGPIPAPRTETAQNSGLGLGLGLVWDTCAPPRSCGLKLVFSTEYAGTAARDGDTAHRLPPLHPIEDAPSVPSFDAGAKANPHRRFQTGRKDRKNKQTLELHAQRSTLRAARSSPGLRPGLAPHWAGPWIGFRRDSRAAVSAGRRPCNGNQRTKTGTNHRTLASRPLAHPRRPVTSPDGLGGVGGLSIWLWPLSGSSLADHPAIPTSFATRFTPGGPIGVVCRAANPVPVPFPTDFRCPPWPVRHAAHHLETTKLVVASPWYCVVRDEQTTPRTPGWNLGLRCACPPCESRPTSVLHAKPAWTADWAYKSTLSILLCARCLDTHGITSTSGRLDALGPQTSQSAHLTTCAAHQAACNPPFYPDQQTQQAAGPPAPMQTITQAEREWLLICRKQTAHESPLRPEVWQPINALSLTSRAGSGSDSTTSRDRFRTLDPS